MGILPGNIMGIFWDKLLYIGTSCRRDGGTFYEDWGTFIHMGRPFRRITAPLYGPKYVVLSPH